MTRQQLNLLNFIRGYIRANDGVAPSFLEMSDALGLTSKSGVHRLLRCLEEQGYITRLRHRARAIELVEHPQLRGMGKFTNYELAMEAKRRHLVLGHIYRDEYGGREFHPIINDYTIPVAPDAK